MKFFVYFGVLVALLERGQSEQYQTVTDSIKKEINAVTSDLSGVSNEVNRLAEKYHKKFQEFKQFMNQQLTGPDNKMYQWYSQSHGKSSRRCLSSQRNLNMIRSRGNDTTASCLSRVQGILNNLKDKIKRILVSCDRFTVAAQSLPRPCEILDSQDECLTQATEQIAQRKDSLTAIIERFKIYAKLRAIEARVNFKVCHYVGKAYAASHKDGVKSVETCMTNENTHPGEPKENSPHNSMETTENIEGIFDSLEDFNLDD